MLDFTDIVERICVLRNAAFISEKKVRTVFNCLNENKSIRITFESFVDDL